MRAGRVLRGSVLIIESTNDLSRNNVGEALHLFITILNSGASIVTREPRRTCSQDSINDIAALHRGSRGRIRVASSSSRSVLRRW